MTGQELIDYIQNNKLEKAEVFIFVDNYGNGTTHRVSPSGFDKRGEGKFEIEVEIGW